MKGNKTTNLDAFEAFFSCVWNTTESTSSLEDCGEVLSHIIVLTLAVIALAIIGYYCKRQEHQEGLIQHVPFQRDQEDITNTEGANRRSDNRRQSGSDSSSSTPLLEHIRVANENLSDANASAETPWDDQPA